MALLGLLLTQMGCPLLDLLNPTVTPTPEPTSELPVPPSLRLLAPLGGETWLGGGSYVIRWESVGLHGLVMVELLRNGTVIMPMGPGRPATGQTVWDVPVDQLEGSNYSVRVTSQDDPSIFDETDGTIRMSRASISVTTPAGAKVWGLGMTHTITWVALLGGRDLGLDRPRRPPRAQRLPDPDEQRGLSADFGAEPRGVLRQAATRHGAFAGWQRELAPVLHPTDCVEFAGAK